ncbi:MAG: H-NS histone family protein [Proteobacteria bacterium]|nr:MAG: H-NS histone family protein [Pseudomonadota bacterium]
MTCQSNLLCQSSLLEFKSMSTISLKDLNAQIQQLEAQRAGLQAEAEKHRKEATASVVQELIEKIKAYGITAKDLGLSVGKADKTKRGRKPLGAQIAKAGKSGKTYMGPNGQTWSEGTRGRKPAWLTEQLAEGGASDNAEGE